MHADQISRFDALDRSTKFIPDRATIPLCDRRSVPGMAQRNTDVPADQRIEIRICIHVGDNVIIQEAEYSRHRVNIAARLESIAEPGGICISDDSFRQVRGKIDEL